MFYAQFESETTDTITINVTVIRGFTLAGTQLAKPVVSVREFLTTA